jgi:hypothetical protein
MKENPLQPEALIHAEVVVPLLVAITHLIHVRLQEVVRDERVEAPLRAF